MKINEKRYVLRIKINKERIRMVTMFAFLAVLCLPFYTLKIGSIGLLMIIGGPLLLLSIPALTVQLKKTWDSAQFFLVAYFCYNLLSYLWTPLFSVSSFYNFIKIVAIVLCLYCQDYNEREKNFLLAGSVLSCLLLCWFMLGEKNVGYVDGRTTLAVFGVRQDPNFLGYLFLLPLGIAVEGFIYQKNYVVKSLSGLFVGVILLCVMLSGSRGAFLGCAIIVSMIVLKRFGRISQKILFCLVAGVLFLAVYNFLLSLLPEEVAARFSLQVVTESRGTGRLDIWLRTFDVIKKAPYKLLFGFGASSSIPLLGWATHNFLLQILLELGLVGMWLFISFFRIWFKRLSSNDSMCFAVFMGCAGMFMTLSVNTIYYFWVVFILSIKCSKAKTANVRG